MKILHIFPKSNYMVTTNFTKFINEYFDNENHSFVLVGETESFYKDEKIKKQVKAIERSHIPVMIKKYDRVVFHSMFFLGPKVMLWLLLNKSELNKIYWASWGGDLYEWRINYNSKFYSIIHNSLMYLLIKNIKNFVAIFPKDSEYFKQKFKTKANTMIVSYMGWLYEPIANRSFADEMISNREKERTDTINIQVGHQANPSIGHLDIFNKLLKYKNEDMLIHVPLNYGHKSYGDEVEKTAKELFGDKVICYRKMMGKEEYNVFLSQMDAAIYNSKRQIGLYNIYYLLFLGRRIYLNSESVVYKYFLEQDIDVSDFKMIDSLSFKQLYRKSERDKVFDYINRTINNPEYLVNAWSKVFN